MIDSEHIETIAFSYKEVEDMVLEWNPSSNVGVAYQGGIVGVTIDGEYYKDFAYVLNRLHPEYGISPDAISIYVEVGNIWTRLGVDVLVIDGIQ